MSKQVRVRSNLFVFRVFLTAANHSKQNIIRVWSGLYHVFLLIIFESYYHCCTTSNLVLNYSTNLVLIYSTKSVSWKKFFLCFFLSQKWNLNSTKNVSFSKWARRPGMGARDRAPGGLRGVIRGEDDAVRAGADPSETRERNSSQNPNTEERSNTY